MSAMMKRGTGSASSAKSTSVNNQRTLLEWADRFGGWITADLCAHIIWPESNVQRKNAEGLIRRAVDAGYLATRKLPGGSQTGNVYTLTESGAQRVHGIPAINWGQVKDEHWEPPSTFDHDSRTARLLVALWLDGHEIRTGHECLRRYATANKDDDVKIPDGLFRLPGKDWMWLETEGENKSAAGMKALSTALYSIAAGRTDRYERFEAAQGEAIMLRGAALLLPPTNRLDGRTRHIDHRGRIRAAIRRTRQRLHEWSDVHEIGLWVYVEAEGHPWLWRKERDILDFDLFGGDKTQDQGWVRGEHGPPRPDPEKEKDDDIAALAHDPLAYAEAIKPVLDSIRGRPRRERGQLEAERNEARSQTKALKQELEAARRLARAALASSERLRKSMESAQQGQKAAKYDAQLASDRARKAEDQVRALDLRIDDLTTRLRKAEDELTRIRSSKLGRFVAK